jgi:uncharacterized DUF497 family protein
MKYYDWNADKNELLKEERGIAFEDIVSAITDGSLLDVTVPPNAGKYPHQEAYVVNVGDYAYIVPFVEDEQKIFLKTIIPSRKATATYIVNRKKK